MVEVSRKYRYVVRDMDRHGNVRFYLRRPGHQKIRLRASPKSPEFDVEYRLAIAETVDDPKPHATSPTYRWLCHQYFQSVEFKRLNHSTRRTRQLIIEHTWDEPSAPSSNVLFGDCPLNRLTAKLVRVLRDRKAQFPHAANGRVKVLRRMFKWAVENDHIEGNPAQGVAYLQTEAGGYRTWTSDQIAQFEARWPVGTKQRLAFAFLRYLGIRRSDVVHLGRQHARDGWLRFTAKKGEKRAPVTLELPIPLALKSIIEQTDVCGISTFLITDHGRPFSAAGFGIRFREWCDAAELPGLSAHGLRKFAAASLAEAGASAHQLMAWFGWRSLKEAERYTRAANQKKLAASAGVLIDGVKDRT